MLQLDSHEEARRIVQENLIGHISDVAAHHLEDETLQLQELGADSLEVTEILIETETDVQDLLDKHQLHVDHFTLQTDVTPETTIATFIEAIAKAIDGIVEKSATQREEIGKP